MPHYYSLAAKPIHLDEAPDDIGLRFEHADAPRMARMAVR